MNVKFRIKNFLCKNSFEKARKTIRKAVWISMAFFMQLSLTVRAQPAKHTVHGTVVSAVENLPVPGANIILKGTNDGTIALLLD